MPWRSTLHKRRTHLIIPLLIGFFSVAVGQYSGLPQQLVETIKKQYGDAAERRLYAWENLIKQHQDSRELDKIEAANFFMNQAKFIDDDKLWGKTDYWATPIEFLARNAGDCEDFSIAKYFTLKDMGVDTKKLRITYVKALRLNQAHMVLAYYPTPSSVPLILDNLTRQILPATERTDLQPVYSFNADELWLSRTRNEQVKAGSPAQLGKWQDLNNRMTHKDQFDTIHVKESSSVKKPLSSKVHSLNLSEQPIPTQNNNDAIRSQKISSPNAHLKQQTFLFGIHPLKIKNTVTEMRCTSNSFLNRILPSDKNQSITTPCKQSVNLISRYF